MAAVNPSPVPVGTGDFAARVEAARKALAEGIAKAGLQHDPYRFPLEALAMMVGLFPDLVQQLEATRQPIQTDDMRKAVTRGIRDCASEAVCALNVRTALFGVTLGIGLLLAGAVGGYLYHGSAQVIAGVSAGAQQCQDQKGGGQICWIPVWGRLPPR